MSASSLLSPLAWLAGNRHDEAVRNLHDYMTTYTGRFFERFAEQSDPNRFEATDIVAVSCLGVDVPPAVSAWLLLEEDGQSLCSGLLEQIGGSPDCNLRTFDLATDAAANTLWDELDGRWGMGPTTVSKLLAAKRPHLMPIYDTYVAGALLPETSRRSEWWEPWQALMRGADGDELTAAVESVRADAYAGGAKVMHLSVLRIIDIVVWRAEEQKRRAHAG